MSKHIKQNNLKNNQQAIDDDEDEGSGSLHFEWQQRLYETYELIHSQHKGAKALVDGFSKEKPNFDDPIINQDLHPLAKKAYFSGIDNTKDISIPSENLDPNIRAELKKQLDYKLNLTQQLTQKPTMTPKPF